MNNIGTKNKKFFSFIKTSCKQNSIKYRFYRILFPFTLKLCTLLYQINIGTYKYIVSN